MENEAEETAVSTEQQMPNSKFFVRGLSGSGKSSILYRLKHGKVPNQIWDMYYDGFDVNYDYEGERFFAWDVNGRQPERGRLLQLYCSNCDGIVFVINSAKRATLDDAIDEMKEDYVEFEANQDKVLMVVANKQDLDDAMSPQELEDIIKKRCKLKLGITLFVMPTSVDTGEGLQVAFEYLWSLMKLKKQKVLKPGLILGAWKNAEQQLTDKNFEDIMKPKKNSSSTSIKEKIKSNSIVKAFKRILNF